MTKATKSGIPAETESADVPTNGTAMVKQLPLAPEKILSGLERIRKALVKGLGPRLGEFKDRFERYKDHFYDNPREVVGNLEVPIKSLIIEVQSKFDNITKNPRGAPRMHVPDSDHIARVTEDDPHAAELDAANKMFNGQK